MAMGCPLKKQWKNLLEFQARKPTMPLDWSDKGDCSESDMRLI